MKNIKCILGILALFIIGSVSCELDTDEVLELESLSVKNEVEQKAENKGFDAYGYNWNAHQFNGMLVNAVIGDTLYGLYEFMGPFTGDAAAYEAIYPFVVDMPFWKWNDIALVMHWNEALISKMAVYPDTWIDSQGWISFHYSAGKGANGWSQFQKMVAARSTDSFSEIEMKWYDEAGNEIGIYSTWDELILIQVVNHGNVHPDFFDAYLSPQGAGLQKYKMYN